MQELVCGDRFRNKAQSIFHDAFLLEEVGAVAAGKNSPERGVVLPKRLEHLFAVLFRHDDIENEKLHRVPMLPELLDRIIPVRGFDHGIAELLEDLL
jgi:hypothetical protein